MDFIQATENVLLAQAHAQLVQMAPIAHHAKPHKFYREHSAKPVAMMVASMILELANNVLRDAINVQEPTLALNVETDIS